MTDERSPSPLPAPASGKAIALCLSGGGLRATLFHLGVVRALRGYQLGGRMALQSVREVYAVSGGSILAAHLLRNYEGYVGTDEEFEKLAHEVLSFAARDIRNRVLRRWGLSWWLKQSRGTWLQREYRHFLDNAKIGACYCKPGVPIFHFLSTNFNTGELCSFSGKKFEKTHRIDGTLRTARTPADGLPLAIAVTASSSFPPMFPPIRLTPEMLNFPSDPEFGSDVELSDGGVYDNFGIEKFRIAERLGPIPDLLLVSHAGGSFDTAPDKRYGSMLSRNIRASDIMMRRVGDTTLEAAKTVKGKGYELIRIGATVDDGALEESTQQLIRLVRTDLDRFRPELAQLLVGHGRRVAGAAFAERGWPRQDGGDEPITALGGERLAEIARRAAHRQTSPLFLDFRDFGWLAVWWLLVAAVVAASGLGVQTYLTARKAEETKQEDIRNAQVKLTNDQDRLLNDIRIAATTGNLAEIRDKLAIAIVASQDLGNDPNAPLPENAPSLNAGQVRQIIADAPLVPPLGTSQYPQSVYIQFAGLLTRAQITALNEALKEAGWRTESTSGERTPLAADLNEVRYAGDNLPAAQALADAINRSGLLAETVVLKELEEIGPANLEVWISR